LEGGVTVTNSTLGQANLLDNDYFGADENVSLVTMVQYYKTIGVNTLTDVNVDAGTGTGPLKTRYGILSVWRDGTWSYTSDSSVNHVDPTTRPAKDDFNYQITDFDQDISLTTKPIRVEDTAPLITPPTLGIIHESSLIYNRTTTGLIPIIKKADSINVTFNAPSPPSSSPTFLKSGGVLVDYQLSNSGHTLTAVAGSNTVFVVNISDFDKESAFYTFTQYRKIDYGSAPIIDLDLKYKVVDGDLDTIGDAGGTTNYKLTVVVVNDDLYTFTPTDSNDSLLFDGTTFARDMKLGNDTLLFSNGVPIDLNCSTPPGLISNVEIFDLSVTGVNQITNLTAAYVDTITDARNTLYILGTTEDIVRFDTTLTTSGSSTQTLNGHVYSMTQYTGTNATVYIQDGVSVNP